jgi:hypothetical protein
VNNLVYLAYGEGRFIREAMFSILSAIHCEDREKKDWRFVIYTDSPSRFESFDAVIEPLDTYRLSEWAGPANFNHRRKIFALQHALRNYGSSVYVDGDTYFLKSPRKLFWRVSSGNSMMHLREGRLGLVLGQYSEFRPLCQSFCAAPFEVFGRSYEFTPNWLMWNAGVVGISLADEHLFETVVMLTDAIHQRSPSLFSEQLAFGRVLEEATRMREANDVVYHYFHPHLRFAFQEVLAKVLKEPLEGNLKELSDTIYSFRQRSTLLQRVKAGIKELLFNAGAKGLVTRSSAL